MRVNLPLSSMNSRNSTPKTIMAVASEAKKLLSETPSSDLPWPPVCDNASSRAEVMVISSQSGAERLGSDEDDQILDSRSTFPRQDPVGDLISPARVVCLVGSNRVGSNGGRAAHGRSGVDSEVKSITFQRREMGFQKERRTTKTIGGGTALRDCDPSLPTC